MPEVKINKKAIKRASNANYKAGYRSERKAFQTLVDSGYSVMRSAGSHGTFDLMAFNETQFVLIQLKLCPYGKLSSYQKVKDSIVAVKVPFNCKKELWVYERRVGFHIYPL